MMGTKQAILVSLVIWLGAVVYAYGFLETQTQFFMMSAVIALVLGGSQALSRSLFSLMIPSGQESEYFSLYEVSERGTSWLGPFLFSVVLQMTHSYRMPFFRWLCSFWQDCAAAQSQCAQAMFRQQKFPRIIKGLSRNSGGDSPSSSGRLHYSFTR